MIRGINERVKQSGGLKNQIVSRASRNQSENRYRSRHIDQNTRSDTESTKDLIREPSAFKNQMHVLGALQSQFKALRIMVKNQLKNQMH